MDAIDYPRRAEAAFNDRDLATLGTLWAPDFHYVAPGEETHSREEGLARERALLEAMPDLRADLSRHFADRERLVIEGTLTGTHTGPLRLATGAVLPTGRRITIRFVGVFSFAAGVVTSERVYYDRLELMQQLGVVTP
jgi:ketosteroid isomerase-like protein